MTEKILFLMEELDAAKTTLEELQECGDLEDILAQAQEVEDIEARLFRARLEETGGL